MYLLILTLFFISGALGLGYQVLWSKYLLDFIGVSAYSYATVLAAFMGGLAIGSWWLGRWADRMANPLKLYAYLEVGVGLYAVIYLPLREWTARLYAQWIHYTPEHAGAATGIWAKIVVSAILLLPPTILMGGTYPALVRHVTESMRVVGRRASQLYAVNAFGAVLGTLAMAFLFMPVLGMRASLMLLALLNGLVGLTALLLTRYETASGAAAPGDHAMSPAAGADVPEWSPWLVRVGLLVIFIEGLMGFAYEIAWTRFFGIVLGSSTYSFSIMLAAFISGIAIGSAILARLDARIRNPMAFFGWTQLGVGLTVIALIPVYPYIPWFFQQYASLFSQRVGAFYLYESGKLLLCFLIMLVPTVLIGMSLPLVVKGLSRSLARLGYDTGRVYAWDTWGNVTGSLLSGLLLLPVLGVERLLRFSAIGNGILGLGIVALYTQRNSRRRWTLAVAGAVVVWSGIMAWHVLAGPWDPRWFSLAPFRRTLQPPPLRVVREQIQHRRMLLFKDDPAAHLMVVEFVPARNNPVQRKRRSISLFVNGKVDASSIGDMPTQILSGHIPLVLHPDPKDVLIIGLASGTTAGAVLKHPIRRLDVVDIIRAMPEATRIFSPWNGNPFADPRFHLIVDDARSYLLYTRQKYDVIISEPSNPWMAGTGALFSRDFYERARHVLRPHGIYLQWVQAYEMHDETFAAMVRSFRAVFPYVYGFQGNSKDVLLLGSLQPIRMDWSQMQTRLRYPEVAKQLAEIHIDRLSALLYLQHLSPITVDLIASFTDMENTDDNHFLEYRAPRDLFQRFSVTLIDRLDNRLHAPTGLFWYRYIHSPAFTESRTEMMRGIIAVMQDRRMQNPRLLRLWQAQLFVQERAHTPLSDGPPLQLSDTQTPPPFPLAFYLQPPWDPRDVMTRFTQLSNRPELQQALILRYRTQILLESQMDVRMARKWWQRLRPWIARFAQLAPLSRQFTIELAVLSHHPNTARRLMRQWLHQKDRLPPLDWALLQGCHLDPAFCQEIVQRYRKIRPLSALIQRFTEWQRHAAGSSE